MQLRLCEVDVRCKIDLVFPVSHLLLVSSLAKRMACYEMQGVYTGFGNRHALKKPHEPNHKKPHKNQKNNPQKSSKTTHRATV